MIGAATPIVAVVGNKPISTVAMPMIIMDSTSIFLRPSLSPKCPNTMPPNGL